jgi:hypothetical protein
MQPTGYQQPSSQMKNVHRPKTPENQAFSARVENF